MIFSLHQGWVVMSSQITHTIIKIHPLAHLLDTWALIFSSCSIFTVYPKRIMWRHPSTLQVITTRAREGDSKEHSAKQKWPRETHSVTYVPGFSTLSNLSRIVAQPPLSILCCLRPPSHQPSSLTSVSFVPVLHWLRPSTPFWPYGTHPFFPHAQTISILWSALLANSLSIPALLRTSSFLTLSIRDTPTKLLKHFISRTFTFLLSELLIPHTSAPSNAVGTITPSYRHFLAFIPNPLLLRTLFSAPQALYPSFILCTTSLSHPPSAANYDPRYLKQSTSSNGSPFSITCIRSPLPYLEHFISLLLPTFTLNFLFSHTLSYKLIYRDFFPP